MRIKIDGKVYKGKSDESTLDLAKRNKINIPNLCHKKGFEGQGRCRLCLVEVDEKGRKKIVSSCLYPLKDGLEVTTSTEEIIRMRRDIVFLLAQRTPNNPYINELAEEYKITKLERFSNEEDEDCILCGLCIEACEKLGSSAISFANRGITKKVTTPFDDASLDCLGCGACAEVCPTNAIKIKEDKGIRSIWNREFDLARCNSCGKYYTTIESLRYAESFLDSEDDYVCESCKKRSMGSRFKEIF